MKLFELINQLEDLDCHPNTEVIMDRHSDAAPVMGVSLVKGIPHNSTITGPAWVEITEEFEKIGKPTKIFVYISL